MRINKITFMMAAAAALVGLISTSGTAAIAAEGNYGASVHKKGGTAGQHMTQNANSSGQMRRRNFSENHDDGDHDYGRHHRRHRGFGFGGISINLGDIDSSCRYSYRKWQATGSRYWRTRYYDCIG
jgi:hypothetical protein